jgi:hypothetical protein
VIPAATTYAVVTLLRYSASRFASAAAGNRLKFGEPFFVVRVLLFISKQPPAGRFVMEITLTVCGF